LLGCAPDWIAAMRFHSNRALRVRLSLMTLVYVRERRSQTICDRIPALRLETCCDIRGAARTWCKYYLNPF